MNRYKTLAEMAEGLSSRGAAAVIIAHPDMADADVAAVFRLVADCFEDS